MFSYIQLKSFVVLCETGSFSKAALKMATNQPTITKRIQQIESYLDKTLLHRRTNGKEILLTEDGENFLLHAENIIKSYELLDEAFYEENEENVRLNIGSVKAVFHMSLAHNIKALSEKYPKLDVHVDVRGTDDLVTKLKNKELDIIFIIGDGYHSAEVETKFIEYLDIGWYASEGLYKTISKMGSVVEIFANVPIMLCKDNSPATDMAKRTLKNNNIKDYTINLSDSMQTMFELINDGFGIGYLPKKFINWDNNRKVENFLIELKLFVAEGLSLHSAILKNSNKKQYYDFIMTALEKENNV